MIKQKRGMGALAWILIILVIIVIGIGIYFWLSSGSYGGSALLNSGSGSIPQPPVLPAE